MNILECVSHGDAGILYFIDLVTAFWCCSARSNIYVYDAVTVIFGLFLLVFACGRSACRDYSAYLQQ